MSAILNGIRDRIKDRHPDSFSFREYDIEMKTGELFPSKDTLSSSLLPRMKTVYEFSWGWELTTSSVSCTLSVDADDVVFNNRSISMWVKSNQVAWRHNGTRVGPEFSIDNVFSQQTVSFRKNDRRHPDGLMTLLDATLEASAA